eukprot:scaffold4562_cov178-Amphora_coffeaeformis.AAC.9
MAGGTTFKKRGTSGKPSRQMVQGGVTMRLIRIMDASIIIGNRLQNISPDPNGKPQKEDLGDVLAKYSPIPVVDRHQCMEGNRNFALAHICNPVYRDFAHFMGKKKPLFKVPCQSCGAKDLNQPQRRWFEDRPSGIVPGTIQRSHRQSHVAWKIGPGNKKYYNKRYSKMTTMYWGQRAILLTHQQIWLGKSASHRSGTKSTKSVVYLRPVLSFHCSL